MHQHFLKHVIHISLIVVGHRLLLAQFSQIRDFLMIREHLVGLLEHLHAGLDIAFFDQC